MISGYLVQAQYDDKSAQIISSAAYRQPGDAVRAYNKLINELEGEGFSPDYSEDYTTYDEEYPCCYLSRFDGVENRVKVYKLPIKIK